MDIKQLKMFAAVVDEGGFHKAAEKMSVTQPAVSTAVRKLEDELGVKLLDRLPNGLQKTTYGDVMHRCAKTVENDMRNAINELGALQDMNNARLDIGVSLTFPIARALRVLRPMVNEAPGMRVSIQQGWYAAFKKMLLEGHLDMFMSALDREESDDRLQQIPLMKSPVVVVADPSHPKAQKSRVSLKSLQKEKWLSVGHPDNLIPGWTETFAAAGCAPPDFIFDIYSPPHIEQAIIGSDYIAPLPLQYVEAQVARGVLTVLKTGDLGWTQVLGLCFRRHKSLSIAASVFIDRLKGDFGEVEL